MNPFDEDISDHDLAQQVVNLLTERELECFELMWQGHRNKEISRRLGVAYNTIGTFRQRILTKLNLSSTMCIGVLGWRIRKQLHEGLVLRQFWKSRGTKSCESPIDNVDNPTR